MLTVSEARTALTGASYEAICFLPGGGHLRGVRIEGPHVFFTGDEEATGTPEERKQFSDVCKKLADKLGKSVDDPAVVELAQSMIDTVQGKVEDARHDQPGETDSSELSTTE